MYLVVMLHFLVLSLKQIKATFLKGDSLTLKSCVCYFFIFHPKKTLEKIKGDAFHST